MIYVDETNPIGKEAKYLVKCPQFAQAFLHTRRRQKEGLIELYWIKDAVGDTLEIGSPEDWRFDIAAKIKSKDATVTILKCGRTRAEPPKKMFTHRYDSVNESSDNMFIPLRRRGEKQLPSFTKNLEYACRSERGKLDYQEDRYTFIKDFQTANKKSKRGSKENSTPKRTYIGVFDGHGGTLCAQEASENLHRLIQKNMNNGDICESMKKAFLQFDDEFCQKAQKTRDTSGAVACCVIIEDRTVYVANIGDCAAVLCRQGETILLSDEHPPGSEQEVRRIKLEGGTISRDGRLNGDLAVSRSFGDLIFPEKDLTAKGTKAVGLSAIPVVKKHYLCEEDEFLIVACDGIFDYVNYKISVQTVRRNLRRYNDVQRANSRLVQIAAAVPSMDNMTAVLVAFPKLEDGKRVIVKQHNSYHSKPPLSGKRRKFTWTNLKESLSDLQS